MLLSVPVYVQNTSVQFLELQGKLILLETFILAAVARPTDASLARYAK